MYAPESPYTVYCRDCWWSDKWNALDYGRDFDFTRPFFEQFDELSKAVPKCNLLIFNSLENCDYCNYQNDSRNCYLTFGSGFMEDCMYTDWVYYAKNTIDCSFCQNSEMDYMNVDCSKTYHCGFCRLCRICNGCIHCFDLRNCKNCFGCVGLRGKEFHIFNKPYSKEEYEKKVRELKRPENINLVAEEYSKLKMAHPHIYSQLINCENCTGNDIENSKNCRQCFDVKDSEDCVYNYDAIQNKDVMDTSRTGLIELGYECSCGGFYQHVRSICGGAHVSFSDYCFECMNSKYIFGCVGVNHQDYVILNKKYLKEEYEKIVPKIIEHMKRAGEWGEFFPAHFSPFPYNNSVAYDFFPLTEKMCGTKGLAWHETEHVGIESKTKNIVENIVTCEITGKKFRITDQELRFYRDENLPLPTKCPNQRYRERLTLKNPRRLFSRACAKCGAGIRTTYAPDRPEKVYCETCYLETVY
jgi:hypothetical protein